MPGLFKNNQYLACSFLLANNILENAYTLTKPFQVPALTFCDYCLLLHRLDGGLTPIVCSNGSW